MRYFLDSCDGGMTWRVLDSDTWGTVTDDFDRYEDAKAVCTSMNEEVT